VEFPYKSRNKNKARQHRIKGYLLSEVFMWKALQKKQFLGLTFNRQITVGPYIVDFFCARAKVVIEIDGESHDGKEEYDSKRESYLSGLGLTVIRFNALEVNNNLEGILWDMKQHPAFAKYK